MFFSFSCKKLGHKFKSIIDNIFIRWIWNNATVSLWQSKDKGNEDDNISLPIYLI